MQKWSEVSEREEMDVGSEMGRNVAFEDWNEMKWFPRDHRSDMSKSEKEVRENGIMEWNKE